MRIGFLGLAIGALSLVFGLGSTPAQGQSICVLLNVEINGDRYGTGSSPVCLPPADAPGVPGLPGLPATPALPALPSLPLPALPVP